MSIVIRYETPTDLNAIRTINHRAFGQEDEACLVDALREGGFVRLSLVAEYQGQIVGHVLFSDLPIITNHGTVAALSLAPLAVIPEFQRQGIGSDLVRQGLDLCRQQGHQIVVVLGHPEFYTRFGFSSELAQPLQSPFSGPPWMAIALTPRALDGVQGVVKYPPPFGLDAKSD